jgi:hypothetical protein
VTVLPGREEHKAISKAFTGREADEVHATIDLPFLLEKYKRFLTPEAVEQLYKELRPANSKYASGHRQAFHTLEEAILLGNLIDGQRGIENALLHLLADEAFHDKNDKQWLKLITPRKERRHGR